MSARQRRAGVMLPAASLPSRHGIGDLGGEARRFVDLLRASGLGDWQLLPLNPLGYGNSPYQPYSSFAGDPLYISLDALYEEGLLAERPQSHLAGAGRIDYESVRRFKDRHLRLAFEAFRPDAAYEAFLQNAWAYPYAVFMALKRHNGMRPWTEWPEAQRHWPYDQGAYDLSPHEEAIRYELFLQHTFHRQWLSLKEYAGAQGIRVIGDIPIYVGLDSQDVWAHRENFLLDADGRPTVVAGVPPDYFSETGQRWGNPIYDWEHLKRSGFRFWIDRLRYSATLFDVVRIDHFRAFDTYWEIPASCPTAVEGIWKEAPGYALFDAVFEALPGLTVIAEDLGLLREEVYRLRDHYGLRGMKVLQFTFRPEEALAPKAGRERMIVYTGTHDNDTTCGWFGEQPIAWRLQARGTLWRAGYRNARIARCFMRLALDDAADMAILPAQDVLGLGAQARLNTPGTVGSPNWAWRLASFRPLKRALRWLARAVQEANRGQNS